MLVPMIEDAGRGVRRRTIAEGDAAGVRSHSGGEDLADRARRRARRRRCADDRRSSWRLRRQGYRRASLGAPRTVADYNDLAGIEKSVREARTHGFDGASCVHPAVVPILNKGFSPSEKEVDEPRDGSLPADDEALAKDSAPSSSTAR